MRALREQPRITVAKVLVVVGLVVAGAAVGSLLDGDGGDRVQVTQARLASAQRSLATREAELRLGRERIERAEAALGRVEHDARVLTRANRRLRRELRAARRARRQAK